MSVMIWADEGLRIDTPAQWIEDILHAFGFDVRVDDARGVIISGTHEEPLHVPNPATETVHAVALAHHLLGLRDEQFREVGLMLAQRPDTWREFDSARRLGAETFDMQQILLRGLFNEVPRAR